MKIARYKRTQRILSFYHNNFGISAPYKVLIDGTFCKAALESKLNIREQLPIYLNGPVKLMTTDCVLRELGILGSQFYGAKLVASQFFCEKCGHEGISAVDCSKSFVKSEAGAQKYFVATLDPLLQNFVREVAGYPLLFVRFNSILIEKPSEGDLAAAQKDYDEKVNYASEKDVLHRIKENVLGPQEKVKKRRKKKGGPNPLSCKKKKKTVPAAPRDSRKKRRTRHRKQRSEIGADS